MAFFKRNWDLILAYAIPILAIILTWIALQGCNDWGCLGLIFIGLAGIGIGFLFFLVAAIRNFFVKNPMLRWIATGVGLILSAVPTVYSVIVYVGAGGLAQ